MKRVIVFVFIRYQITFIMRYLFVAENRFDILCIQEYYKCKTNRRRPRCSITQHPVHREINLEHGNRKLVDKVLHAVALDERSSTANIA